MHDYLSRWWNRSGYLCTVETSYEEFRAMVGERPSPEHKLQRIDKGAKLDADNYVWVTSDSIESAKNGVLSSPSYPHDHPDGVLPEEENNRRFALFIADTLERGMGKVRWHTDVVTCRAAIKAIYAKVESRLAQIPSLDIDLIPQWRDPDALPPVIAHSKFLTEARERVTKEERRLRGIIDNYRLYVKDARRRNPGRPKKVVTDEEKTVTQWRDRSKQEKFVYTGKRGRPPRRYDEIKVRIVDLTPEQREQFGLAPDATRMASFGPTGQPSWKQTVTLRVPRAQTHQRTQTTGP